MRRSTTYMLHRTGCATGAADRLSLERAQQESQSGWTHAATVRDCRIVVNVCQLGKNAHRRERHQTPSALSLGQPWTRTNTEIYYRPAAQRNLHELRSGLSRNPWLNG
jgi:hypothetical protein